MIEKKNRGQVECCEMQRQSGPQKTKGKEAMSTQTQQHGRTCAEDDKGFGNPPELCLRIDGFVSVWVMLKAQFAKPEFYTRAEARAEKETSQWERTSRKQK